MKNGKILLIIGNGKWSYNSGLSFGAQMGSSEQFVKRIKDTNRELSALGLTGIDIIKTSEAYTSKVCHSCLTKSLKQTYKDVKVMKNGVEVTQRKMTRFMQCTSSAHIKTYINRDLNASINIGLNVRYSLLDQNLGKTTWKIGRNE